VTSKIVLQGQSREGGTKMSIFINNPKTQARLKKKKKKKKKTPQH